MPTYLKVSLMIVALGGLLYLAVDWGAAQYTAMERDLESVRNRGAGGFEKIPSGSNALPMVSSSDTGSQTIGSAPTGANLSLTPSPRLAVRPTTYSNVVVCMRNLDAFSPTNSAERIGLFRAGTILTLGAKDPVTQMVLATHRSRSGIEMQAKCRAAEVGR